MVLFCVIVHILVNAIGIKCQQLHVTYLLRITPCYERRRGPVVRALSLGAEGLRLEIQFRPKTGKLSLSNQQQIGTQL